MSATAPPPWLINQQRYGPPPSYPALRIPGLNAPIPPGSSWGFGPGQWGRPPVDEWGRGLYGDVFGHGGTQNSIYKQHAAPIEHLLWGEIEEADEDESEVEEEVAEEEVENVQEEAKVVEKDVEIDDLEPEVLEIRKAKRYVVPHLADFFLGRIGMTDPSNCTKSFQTRLRKFQDSWVPNVSMICPKCRKNAKQTKWKFPLHPKSLPKKEWMLNRFWKRTRAKLKRLVCKRKMSRI
jgi:hypothetical protein